MNAKHFNKPQINDLISKMNSDLSIHISMIAASDIWDRAIYFNRVSINATDYVDTLFNCLCIDGNIAIDTSMKLTKKQLFCLLVIESTSNRKFTIEFITNWIKTV